MPLFFSRPAFTIPTHNRPWPPCLEKAHVCTQSIKWTTSRTESCTKVLLQRVRINLFSFLKDISLSSPSCWAYIHAWQTFRWRLRPYSAFIRLAKDSGEPVSGTLKLYLRSQRLELWLRHHICGELHILKSVMIWFIECVNWSLNSFNLKA